MKLIVLLFVILASAPAFSQSLFNDDVCPSESGARSSYYSAQLSLRTSLGLSCQDLRALEEATSYTRMILAPAALVIASNPALGAELAAAGLTLSNPAVLSVVVVGAIGVKTLQIVMKASLEECARQDQEDLRASIMREIEAKYGLQPNQSSMPLEIEQ